MLVPDDKFPHLIRIKYDGGGPIPKDLEGMYVTPHDAEKMINRYREKLRQQKRDS